MAQRNGNGVEDRVRILERAVADLGDSLTKREGRVGEEIKDILRELKALKLFLARTAPEFKGQFPGIQRKVK